MLYINRFSLPKRACGSSGFVILALAFFASCSPKKGDSPFGPNGIAQKNLPKKGALVRAAGLGDRVQVTDLLIAGADVNESVGEANAAITPLLAAVATGKQDVARMLIQSGASVQPTFEGYSAIDYARASNLTEVLREMATAPSARGR